MNRCLLLLIMAFASFSGGCASITNPVADGIPVRRLPAEVLGRPKADMKPIPLTALKQAEPDPYRLDKGDVLAVIADNLVSQENQPSPVKLPDQSSNTAALGYPFPINEDGTITIPRMDPIMVKGLSVAEAEELIRDTAFGRKGNKDLIKPTQRVSVQLLQKRRYQITVVREDSQPVPTTSGSAVFGGNRRGNGFSLSLIAGENDVLRAMNATGGPPGLDAKNEIVIYRSAKDKKLDDSVSLDSKSLKTAVMNGDAIATRIPLRLYPEQQLKLNESDVLLKDGDIVYIEARDTEVYYTMGLLGAGQFPLPRDFDLDVIQAIAAIRGPLLNGGFTQNLFVANSVGTGIGAPSPSLCIVLRKVSPTQQIPIRVDLNRAFIDPRERILIQPGDMIVLQERPGEAVGRYMTQTIRHSTTLETIRQGTFIGTGTTNLP
ncbi:MAG: polysaccharide biosynthesis/export family protein [Fimbriiglobus sp.]